MDEDFKEFQAKGLTLIDSRRLNRLIDSVREGERKAEEDETDIAPDAKRQRIGQDVDALNAEQMRQQPTEASQEQVHYHPSSPPTHTPTTPHPQNTI